MSAKDCLITYSIGYGYSVSEDVLGSTTQYNTSFNVTCSTVFLPDDWNPIVPEYFYDADPETESRYPFIGARAAAECDYTTWLM